ncbi:hypothetical protein MCETHM1_00865 [Flavobacteriaceae bacterium]
MFGILKVGRLKDFDSNLCKRLKNFEKDKQLALCVIFYNK